MSLAAKHNIGLDLAGLGDLASMLDEPVDTGSGPRMFNVSQIQEDERNSRHRENPGFSEESIAELAASIRERGIKSPLSLRPAPVQGGHFIINHGHRRFRAAIAAGLTQVPAFVDEAFDEFDQMIENIHRENLTAREIADFIGGQLAHGKTQTEIARQLGKSKAYVSQHVKLLDLPEPVADAFNAGLVRDVTVANELARAHRENPAVVEAALGKANQEQSKGLAAKPITRAAVQSFRAQPEKTATAEKGRSDRGLCRWSAAERRLGERLCAAVAISDNKISGSICVEITVKDANHLRQLLLRLGCDLGN